MNRSLTTLVILGGLAYLACAFCSGLMSNWRNETFIVLFWTPLGLFLIGLTIGGMKYREPSMLVVAATLGFISLAFGGLIAAYAWLGLDC